MTIYIIIKYKALNVNKFLYKVVPCVVYLFYKIVTEWKNVENLEHDKKT